MGKSPSRKVHILFLSRMKHTYCLLRQYLRTIPRCEWVRSYDTVLWPKWAFTLHALTRFNRFWDVQSGSMCFLVGGHALSRDIIWGSVWVRESLDHFEWVLRFSLWSRCDLAGRVWMNRMVLRYWDTSTVAILHEEGMMKLYVCGISFTATYSCTVLDELPSDRYTP